MRPSLQLSVSTSVLIALLFGFGSGVVGLVYFSKYEKESLQVMSGENKSLMVGQSIEARITAAEALLDVAVSSADADALFQEKLKNILKEYESIDLQQVKSASVDDAMKKPDDLFLLYRNLKSALFNNYREAWANKWMNVARSMGLMLGDLENMPYYSGSKAVISLNSKLNQLITVVSQSTLGQPAKLAIIGKINATKAMAASYLESYEKSQKLKEHRLSLLSALRQNTQKYNEGQSKIIQKFKSGNNNYFLYAIIAFTLSLLSALLVCWLKLRKFADLTSTSLRKLNEQIVSWISDSGASTLDGVKKPDTLPMEFSDTYELMDGIVKRVNILRREDVIVKRLLHVPFVLISRNQKKAVYWNSALCILGRIRALEETGSIPYNNVIRFSDIQGRPVDPIDRCLIENKEITQLVLFRSGQENIATHVTCVPVQGVDKENEYVMVQIRDLREENRRIENEIDRQLEGVKQSLAQWKETGKVEAPPAWARRQIADSIMTLGELSERYRASITEQWSSIEALHENLSKESVLKKSIHEKLEMLGTRAHELLFESSEVKKDSELLLFAAEDLNRSNSTIANHFQGVVKKAQLFSHDIQSIQTQMSLCYAEIQRAEDLSQKVLATEKSIDQLVKQVSVLNINQSIMESIMNKGASKSRPDNEFNSEKIFLIAENLNQIVVQFQKAYKMIESTVSELSRGFQNASAKMKEQMNTSHALKRKESELLELVKFTNTALENTRKKIDDMKDKAVEVEEKASKNMEKALFMGDYSAKMLEVNQSSIRMSEQHQEVRQALVKRLKPQLISDNHSDTAKLSSS